MANNTKISISGIPQVKANIAIVKASASAPAMRPALEAGAMIIESAAKANAPVVTGTLRRSIHHEVDGYNVWVGSELEYAPFVEFGTRYMAPRAFLRRAYDETKGEVKSTMARIIAKTIDGAA